MPSNPPWTRDELILALDLYKRQGQRDPGHPEVVALSSFLNTLPLADQEHAGTFRNPTGVAMKLGNFAALDPRYPGVGLPRGGRGDQLVWDEFAGQPERLVRTAAAIRAAGSLPPAQLNQPEEGEELSAEGRLLFRLHRGRERDGRLSRRKKALVLAEVGHLACEVCGFDFATTYGERGAGFIEAHHRVALSVIGPSKTSIRDLALVCSNCHRMLHRGSPWPSGEDLRSRF